MIRPHPALEWTSLFRSRSAIAMAMVGAVLLAAITAGSSGAQAQSALPIVYKGELEGLDSLDHYCKRDAMNALLGPPIGRAEIDREFRLRKAVHAYSFHFIVRSEDGEKREPLYIGLYSFQDIPAVMNLGPTILETLGIPRARAILKDVKSCPPVYTAEPAKRTSLPHANLLVARKRATIFEGTRLEIAYVMAMYVGRAKVGAGTVLPPVGGLGPSDDSDAPPGVAGVPKQPPAKGAPPGGPGAGPKQSQAPAPSATPDKSAPRPPVATAPPKFAAPDVPKDGKAPPAAAPPAPKLAQGAQPPAKPSVTAGGLSPEALAKEQENCARGDSLACMIVDRYKAVLAAPKSGLPGDAAAPPSPKAAAPAPAPQSSAQPAPPSPKVAAPAPPPPAPAAPGQPNGAASGKGSVADPVPRKQDDSPPAPAPVKQSKRYPAPAYALLAQPIAPIDAKGREAFVVESIECSEDGNLIVGFVGELKGAPSGKGVLTIRSRFAINNYPTEGRSKRDQLASSVAGFSCAADGRTCTAPRKTIPLIEYRKLIEGEGASAPADPKAVADEWRCIADKGVCYSHKVDNWRCDPSSGECTSFDNARMWCIPRREFCSQTAPFGDWMSPFKAGDVLNVRIAPSVDASGAPIRDTKGNPVFENHVYDMSHGLVPIAEDALMRRCAGYSGPSRTWTSSFPSN